MRCVFRFGTALTRTVRNKKLSDVSASDKNIKAILRNLLGVLVGELVMRAPVQVVLDDADDALGVVRPLAELGGTVPISRGAPAPCIRAGAVRTITRAVAHCGGASVAGGAAIEPKHYVRSLLKS